MLTLFWVQRFTHCIPCRSSNPEKLLASLLALPIDKKEEIFAALKQHLDL